MSVPAGKRKQNRLEVFNCACELCVYTIKITQNEKIFQPQYRSALTDDIIGTAKDIYADAWDANNVYVNTSPKDSVEYTKAVSDWMTRRELQLSAVRKCNRLLTLIGIAKRIFHLDGRRVKYWTGQIITVRTMLRKWNDSDNGRYSKALGTA